MAVPAQPVAVEHRPVEVDDHSVEWWRCFVESANALLEMLAEIPYCDEQHPRVRAHVRRCEKALEAGDLETACEAANAAMQAADRARWERLHGPVGAVHVSIDGPGTLAPRARTRSRARERRPGRRRRASSSASSDDSDSDPEPAGGRAPDDLGPRHISAVLGRYVDELQERAA